MIILSVETSTSRGGVALLRGSSLLALEEWERGRSHSERLTAAIEAVLTKANLEIADVNAIAVDQGPGSFTGLRVGLSAARALGFALDKPVVPVSSFDVLAQATPADAHDSKPLVCLINAQRNLVFTAFFHRSEQGWRRVGAPELLSLKELEARVQTPHLCVGDGYLTYEAYLSETTRERLQHLDPGLDQPQALCLGQVALELLNTASTFDWNQALPLYLRASAAEEKLQS